MAIISRSARANGPGFHMIFSKRRIAEAINAS
jgi:hypothetical protein